MKKKELLGRIEALERRCAALEARPVVWPWPPSPNDWTITWSPDWSGSTTIEGKYQISSDTRADATHKQPV